MRICRRFHRERLFPPSCPQLPRPFGVLAIELFGDPDHRAEDGGAVVAGQVHDAGFDDEITEFDQVFRSLAALDLL